MGVREALLQPFYNEWDMADFDRDHIWHPYTSMTSPLPVVPVESAQGVRIRLSDGRELIDGMSSWWCMIHGYRHPRLDAAVEEQLGRMSHVMFGGLTHEPALRLAEKLVALSPAKLERVFFCDSGSVSVEVAIKMAIQYWHAAGRPEKSRLLTIRGGYHGDTFGAMSVCDPETGMHSIFKGVLPTHLFAPRPESRFGETVSDADLEGMRALLDAHHEQIAAVILEPIVQGAGGMWFYSAEYLAAVAALCRERDVLLILDEIATAFGRTGRLFASEHAGVEPDILCVGKAMTGGYLSMAATLASDEVGRGLSRDGGVLMHGPTFMGNPLAAAVACASIDLLLESPWQERVASIESQLRSELHAYADHPKVLDVRVLGAIGVVQTRNPVPVAETQQIFVDRGVWIRPFNDLIYLMPPYVIEPDDLSTLTQAIGPALDSLE
jgi:adenosylmethionine-8-amino-7-oxononanoate aminotransferase